MSPDPTISARIVRLLSVAALVVTLSAVAAPVCAMPAPVPRPSRFALLAPTEPTPVALDSVTTTLDCRGEDEPVCDFRSVVRTVATGTEHRLTLVLDGHRMQGVRLTVDGSSHAGRPADTPPAKRRPRVPERELPASTRLTRHYDVTIRAAGSEIVVSGTMHPRRPADGAPARVSLPIRHPVLGDDPGPIHVHFDFDLSRLSNWSSTGDVTFEIGAPAGWEVRRFPDVEVVDPVEHPSYAVNATVTPDGLHHGGPYVGFGGRLDDPKRPVGRLGYEVGVGLWSVYGIAVDTDFSGAWVVAPTIHGASAGWSCVFPSFGLGLGPAVRIDDGARVGGRLLLEAQLPFVGVVGSLDWFPGAGSPGVVDFALMGRVSL